MVGWWRGKLSIEGAGKACRHLLKHPDRPSAIFCANDEMAIGCIHQVKNQGLSVPQDISVMGFDDIRYASVMEPALTTIAQPARQIGERVATRLFKAIETGNQPNSHPVILPHKLIIRDSVAAPGV